MTFVKQPANSTSPAKPSTETVKTILTDSHLAIPCKAWQNAADQKEVCARLRQLPSGVAFGDEVGEPIYFDAARKLLLYRGFMCQASYNYLHKLSLDPEYEAAVDQIYMASSTALMDGGRRWRWLVLPILALGAIATILAFWLRH
jgi:hypothetical protein